MGTESDGERETAEPAFRKKFERKAASSRGRNDEEDEDEPVAHCSRRPPPKKQQARGQKRPSEDDASDSEDASTGGTLVKRGKTMKPPAKNAGKTEFAKCVRKDYALPEVDEMNRVIYEALVGGGNYVRLSNWAKNDKRYFQLRKSQTSGINMPIEYLAALKRAMADIEDTIYVQGLLEENQNKGN